MTATPASSPTFWQLLQDQVDRRGGDPAVTFYDERTGERVELSFTTYANWVAKTASLLQDELLVERGDVVVIDLPTHWLGPVWLGAAWALGAIASDGSVEPRSAALVVCGPDSVDRWAREASGQVVGCSLLPLGARFATAPPSPVVDFADVVWSQPDALLVLDPPTGEDLAWRDAEGELAQDQLLGMDAPTGRTLSTQTPTTRAGLASVVGAVRSGAGAVWVTGAGSGEAGRARLETLARTERAVTG